MIIIECGDNKGIFEITSSGMISYNYYGSTEKQATDVKAVRTALRVFKQFIKGYEGPTLWAFVARPELMEFYAKVAPCIELVTEDEALQRHMMSLGLM
jgi:hypothetical protein